MTDFLTSVKADLLDRRLLPIVALVFVGLAAAIAYVLIGGGSSAAPTPPSAALLAPAPAGLTTSQSSTATSHAVAETTNGTPANRHQGKARDPFAALPGVKTVKTSAISASASSSSAKATGGSAESSKTTSTGASGTSSTPSTTPPVKTPAKPVSKAKPHAAYAVSVLFGLLPPGTSAATATLKPYSNLKLQTPIPKKPVLLVYRGVREGGKSATFTVFGEVILHGPANCLPSASQCQAIDLKAGQSEQLEYLSASGEEQTYELRLQSITPSSASTASVRSALEGESKTGTKLLREAGLLTLPYLHYSSKMGVLVFVKQPGPSAVRYRARFALQRAQSGR